MEVGAHGEVMEVVQRLVVAEKNHAAGLAPIQLHAEELHVQDDTLILKLAMIMNAQVRNTFFSKNQYTRSRMLI